MAQGMLEGVRVVELGQYIPAPYAGLSLADLGAEVVKVEPPQGDPMRYVGQVRSGEVSAAYETMNGNKRVLCADLKTPAAQAIVRDLVARADVLIESFRPGVLDRLGLSRNTLAEINPRLVHCAVTGYGQTGPMAMAAGHDLNYMAAGGGLGLSGTAETPVMTRPPVSDFAAAMQAALTILAALYRREQSGQGAHIDIAMAEVVLAWQGPTLTEAIGNPAAVTRAADLETGGLASYQIYRAGCGGFVTLGAEETHFWQRFCQAIGRDDLITRREEAAPQTSLIAILQDVFKTRSAEAWEDVLGPVDCCFQRVLSPQEVLDCAQFTHRQMISRRGPVVDINRPSRIDDAAPEPRAACRAIDLTEASQIWT